MPFEIWLSSIIEIIGRYDIERWKSSWIGNEYSIALSWGEIISSLYDDFSFDDFMIEMSRRQNTQAGELAYKALCEWKDLLDHYLDQKGKIIANRSFLIDVLKDNEWAVICNQAKEVWRLLIEVQQEMNLH